MTLKEGVQGGDLAMATIFAPNMKGAAQGGHLGNFSFK